MQTHNKCIKCVETTRLVSSAISANNMVQINMDTTKATWTAADNPAEFIKYQTINKAVTTVVVSNTISQLLTAHILHKTEYTAKVVTSELTFAGVTSKLIE